MVKFGIVGALGGDEGKGKVVDEIVSYAKSLNDGKRIIVIRFQGGSNAGHTMYVKDKNGNLVQFITHSAPSGLVSNADIAIGPDVAFNPLYFYEELTNAKKVFDYNKEVLISERVGILFDHHKMIDAYREQNDSRKIGTTKSGIGPFYEDNCRRSTRITFNDYVSPNFSEKLKNVLELKRKELELIGLDINEYYNSTLVQHEKVRQELKQYSCRLEYRLNDYVKRDDHIVIEGSQGTILDVNMGTIPDVTSSHLLLPHAFPSLGLSRKDFKIICVEKIYPTRVGNGYLPTHSENEFCERIVKRGGEFGATTGRKRRVGYPDWVLSKRAKLINDADFFYITRIDVVQGEKLLVCDSYEIDGKKSPEVPLELDIVKPIYSDKTYEFRLWHDADDVSKALAIHEKLSPIRQKIIKDGYDNLPKELKEFIEDHDEFVGCKTLGLSLGPATGETIFRKELLDE